MKRIAIIPARSGSKGLKDKNIIDLCGKPLMAYSIEAATETGLFDHVIVSTDSELYARIAHQWGAESMMRGEAQSSDTASTYDVLADMLSRIDYDFDYFVLLQPTSPLRNSQHLSEAVDLFEKRYDEFDFMASIKDADQSRVLIHPLDENGALSMFDIDYSSYRRQNYKDITPNGAIYIAKPEAYLKQKHFYGAKCLGYRMSNNDSVDIDNAIDLMIAKAIIEDRK